MSCRPGFYVVLPLGFLPALGTDCRQPCFPALRTVDEACSRPSEVHRPVRLARLILVRYDSSRRRGRHCRLRAFPAGPQSGSISGHAPARAAKLYDRNHRILPGTYEVTDDLPEELMGRDGGQCIVRISCARDGVGSSISGAPHGSEWVSRYLLFHTAPHNESVHPPIKAQSQLVVHTRVTTTVDQYRWTAVRF
jgi:hypothetical protein